MADSSVLAAHHAVYGLLAVAAVFSGHVDEFAQLAILGRTKMEGTQKLYGFHGGGLFLAVDQDDADLFAIDAFPVGNGIGCRAGAQTTVRALQVLFQGRDDHFLCHAASRSGGDLAFFAGPRLGHDHALPACIWNH